MLSLEHVRVATQSLRDVLGREGSFPLERVRVSTPALPLEHAIHCQKLSLGSGEGLYRLIT